MWESDTFNVAVDAILCQYSLLNNMIGASSIIGGDIHSFAGEAWAYILRAWGCMAFGLT